MDMTFSNKAMQPLSNFGIQFNKNSFGVAPAQPLNVPAISPNQSVDVSLPLNTSGPVQKMDPLTNLQVKNFLQPFVISIPKFIHPKYYKHLKKRCSPKTFRQTKNGLVSGRLAFTSSKTEILNKIGI